MSKTKTRPQKSKTTRQTAAMKRGLQFLESAMPVGGDRCPVGRKP